MLAFRFVRISLQMAKPNPKPVDFVVMKGWNSFGRISGAIPGPLSATTISMPLDVLRVPILTHRSSESFASTAWIALKQRLSITCFAAEASVNAASGEAENSVKKRTFRCAAFAVTRSMLDCSSG